MNYHNYKSLNTFVLSGLAGAGKSSVGNALAVKLGYTYRSAGYYAREEAKRRGISIQELQVQLEKEPEFDRALDTQLIEWGQSHENWVLDYRMGFALLPSAISIFLTVQEDEAVRRIAAANRAEEFLGPESIHQKHKSIRQRNENMKTRLMRLYGVDFTDQSKYDIIVGTDQKTVDEVIKEILQLVNKTYGLNA